MIMLIMCNENSNIINNDNIINGNINNDNVY